MSWKMSYEGAIALLNELVSSRIASVRSKAQPALPFGVRRIQSFQHLHTHLQTLEIDGAISKLSVIHVAGTKGKGSTCAFTESILRSCGYKTGLYTSPHLVNFCERFRFNGVEVSKDLFAKYFWWCWDRLQARTLSGAPMPMFPHLITLIALKMFISENVDVAILEVSLGGRYDSTNIVPNPTVCGITSIGYDHMHVLGNTLGEIASEKGGIIKACAPAFSAPQKPEAISVLLEEAQRVGTVLTIPQPLDSFSGKMCRLSLEGEHQRINAALAVAICAAWDKKQGSIERSDMVEQRVLPDPYIRGLESAHWPGRAQILLDNKSVHIPGTIVHEKFNSSLQTSGKLTYCLDGAHSPESMEACGNWFCSLQSTNVKEKQNGNLKPQAEEKNADGPSYKRVLLFNCMPKRDPHVLFPPLFYSCEKKGFPFHFALFVPPFSDTKLIETRSLAEICECAMENPADLSWQKTLQETWDSLCQSRFAEMDKIDDISTELSKLRALTEKQSGDHITPSSAVMSSIPEALNFLRSYTQRAPNVHLQVLVTGSLYLVGDVIRILKN